MRLPTAISWLFDYPLAGIVAALPEADDPLWDLFSARQQRFKAHSVTRTIPFLWQDPGQAEQRPEVAAVRVQAPRLFDAVSECAAKIEAHYRGTAVRTMLTELPAGSSIPRHVDGGSMLVETHRCHMAVVTNPAVRFEVGDEVFHPAPGQVYEFDNMRQHAVVNLGKTRRVHLICNVRPA